MSERPDSLALDWAAVRPAPQEEGPEQPVPIPDYSDADLIIRTSRDRILAVVHPSGSITYGPEYTPDEAAVTFWEAMGRRRLEMEERILVIQHMERLLTQLGRQDLRTESARNSAFHERNPAVKQELDFHAREQTRRLEMYAQQVFELARGLALREGDPPPLPARIPTTIQHPGANYQGREGLPEDPSP